MNGKKNKNTGNNGLVKNLLTILNLENEIFNSIIKIIEIQYDDILSDKELRLIKEYCKRNLRTTLTKKMKLYEDFYSKFNENDIADIILFYKSPAGLKLQEKSEEFSDINQNIIMSILNNKNLNILIDKFVNDEKNTDIDDEDDDD
jgi:hypothetical protein